MDEKFTPGPWETMESWPLYVVPVAHTTRPLGGSVYEQEDRERFANPIATAAHNSLSSFAHERTGGEARANARLIAAAPDLYAIAQQVADGNFNQAELIKQARAAIAKATGDSSPTSAKEWQND